MGLKYVKGDIFATPNIHIIIHSVNLKNKFDTGIAKQIAERYPWAKEDFLLNYKNLKPGDLLISNYDGGLPAIWQIYTGSYTKEDYIRDGLIKVCQNILPLCDVIPNLTIALPFAEPVKEMTRLKCNVLCFTEYIPGLPAQRIHGQKKGKDNDV